MKLKKLSYNFRLFSRAHPHSKKKESEVRWEKKEINLTKKRLANLPISSDALQVILGGCLGDGSLVIAKNYVNARFAVKHSIKYKDYLLWKAEILKTIASNKAIHEIKPSKKSYGKNLQIKFQSLTKPVLTTIHSIIKKKKQLCIKRSWLNHLQPLGLMIWWLDDGSLQNGWRKGVICCEGFSKKSQLILVKYLKKVWGVKSFIVPKTINYFDPQTHKFISTRQGSRIKMGTTNLIKFLKIFISLIPCESMVYKVCLRYKRSNLQQRWISDLIEALPQYEKLIVDHYKEKYNFNYSDNDIVQ